jgi:ParB-like chromosome segregation protein Spo0J
MDTKSVKVSLERINYRGGRYLMSYGRSVEELERSIRAVGVINEPLLLREQDSEDYETVSGFGRLRACKRLGIMEVGCRELLKPTAEREIFLIALEENFITRGLNDIEKGMVLTGLKRYFSEREIVKEYLPVLGMEASYERYEQYVSLMNLEKEIKDEIVGGRVSFGTAQEMLRLGAEERAALLALIERLNLGVNLQKELVGMLIDISRRDCKGIGEVLSLPAIAGIIRDESEALGKRTEGVRREIKRMRYPGLAAKEREFAEFVRECELGSGMKIEPPAFFEGGDYAMTARFRSEEEFKEAARRISDIAQRGIPAKIFE